MPLWLQAGSQQQWEENRVLQNHADSNVGQDPPELYPGMGPGQRGCSTGHSRGLQRCLVGWALSWSPRGQDRTEPEQLLPLQPPKGR